MATACHLLHVCLSAGLVLPPRCWERKTLMKQRIPSSSFSDLLTFPSLKVPYPVKGWYCIPPDSGFWDPYDPFLLCRLSSWVGLHPQQES